MRRLTAAEERLIITLWSTPVAGVRPSVSSIARQVERSRSAVEHCLRRAGLLDGPQARVTKEEKERIVTLYQTRVGERYLSMPEVAELVGRATNTVHRVLTEAGAARTLAEVRPRQLTAETRERIVQVFRVTGWSYLKVADFLDLRPHVVYAELRHAHAIGPHRRVRLSLDEVDKILYLYQLGLSQKEVRVRTGHSERIIAWLTRLAGVHRDSVAAAVAARARRDARERLTRMPLSPVVEEWLQGTPADVLSRQLGVPADLLWDAIAPHLPSLGAS